MDNTKPIKRSIELQPLSRDHHFGLLLCWKVRTGIAMNVEPERIAEYVLFFYKLYLRDHFQEEEKYVFTLIADDDSAIRRALEEHRKIELVIKNIEKNIPNYSKLSEFEQILNNHIRYEERELFPYIEQISAGTELRTTGDIIASIHDDTIEPVWSDEFWVKKN